MYTNSFAKCAGRWACRALWVGAALWTISSCSNEENTSLSSFGHVSFQISVVPDTVTLDGRTISLSMESADGEYSHTWADYREFSSIEGFYSGPYTARAVLGTEGDEGYGCECYVGTADFDVLQNHRTTVNLVCTLSQAMFTSSSSGELLDRFPDAGVILHSAGASYVDVEIDRDLPALVTPGATSVLVRLADGSGSAVVLDTGLDVASEADSSYDVVVGMADDVLTVTVGALKAEIPVNDSLLAGEGPRVVCSGFSEGVPVSLTEGVPAKQNILISVESDTPLRSVMVSAVGRSAEAAGLPSECDILSDAGAYADMGLDLRREGAGSLAMDFTTLLENLSVMQKLSDLCFMVQAVDEKGRASEVATLRVAITGVEMSVVSASSAMVGEDVASVTLQFNVTNVEGSDFAVVLDDRTTPDVEPLEIISAEMEPDTHFMVISFRVPGGISSLPVRIDYMGNPKVALNIERELPDFDFAVDAFATTVVATISGPTAAETSAITKYARILADGKEMAVLDRDTENGILYCSGFSPDRQYTVECSVLKNVKPASARIRTEKATQVPDGNFEDVTDLISYKLFPSGGTYSATSFPIFNQQNFVDINVKWPRNNWSSINEKTFCPDASTHNTWYMQASSAVDFEYFAAGTKSMRMSSVGWSLNGPEIPPYVQPVDAFESYNANYPPIDNISAGYLFLGNYSFNPADLTEVTTEGVKFASRPSSLNGFFKYTPDEGNPSDRGWVRVELIGDGPSGQPAMIGSGYLEFAYAPDFRTFNIPISYTSLFVPATRLKILFCSSVHSDGLSFDDPEVPVTADIPNSRYIGSTLWIDNLSFSY